MSVSNLGSTMNQIEGFIASEFNTATNTQGLAMFPRLIRDVASRADLTGLTLKVVPPRYFDGTNDVAVSTTAARLIGVVAMSNASLTEDAAILFYNTASVTEGTSLYNAAVFVSGASTLAGASAAAVVYAEPVPFATALNWSAVDNGSTTDIEGTSLADANGVLVMVVYAN